MDEKRSDSKRTRRDSCGRVERITKIRKENYIKNKSFCYFKGVLKGKLE